MCEYCDNIKKIVFSKVMSDEDKLKQIEEETNKEIFLDFLDANQDLGVTYEELGLTQEDLDNAECYEIEEEDKRETFGQENFKLINLYKYTSYAYGSKGYGKNSRRFCVQLSNRTNASLMRYQDIVSLNGSNPGLGKGGSDYYSIFDWRGDSHCKHYWIKYFYDTESMKMVKAPNGQQPIQRNKGNV